MALYEVLSHISSVQTKYEFYFEWGVDSKLKLWYHDNGIEFKQGAIIVQIRSSEVYPRRSSPWCMPLFSSPGAGQERGAPMHLDNDE